LGVIRHVALLREEFRLPKLTVHSTCGAGRPHVGLCAALLVFFRHAFSEIPRPIALKPCHMIGIWLNFIVPLHKFWGGGGGGGGGGAPPHKKWVPKICKISLNFVPLRTLIANISGTRQHIQNWKTLQTRAIRPAFNEKVW